MGNISGDLTDRQYTHTPFGANKNAPQFVQLSVDPSQGLTRKRYGWLSNGVLFDSTLVTEVEAGIRLETTATGTDIARVRSAYPGQYISQSEAMPGFGAVMDESNVEIDSDGLVSLSHGEIYGGAFYWDAENDQVDTGIGYKWDTDRWEFFVKSLGDHLGPSPIPQAEFGFEKGNDESTSGIQIDPADGYIYNLPHTWYNEGPLSGAWLNPTNNRVEELVRVVVDGRPSIDTPNLPVQLVARNAGTAQSLGVELGGLQYSTYGAGREDLERRQTPEGRKNTNGVVDQQVVLTDEAPDPAAEPGTPLISGQREPGRKDLNLRITDLSVKPVNDDMYLYAWDEFDPDTALTGANFNDPVSPNNAGRESHILTDTVATDYTPTTATLRGWEFFEGGKNKETDAKDTDIDIRVPLGATRVITGVNNSGTAVNLNPLKVTFEEGY